MLLTGLFVVERLESLVCELVVCGGGGDERGVPQTELFVPHVESKAPEGVLGGSRPEGPSGRLGVRDSLSDAVSSDEEIEGLALDVSTGVGVE